MGSLLPRWGLLSALLLLLAGQALAAGPDWPAWRGPRRDGISTETGLLESWPAKGPKLLWKVDALGEGYGTPAVAQGRLYALGNRDGQEQVIALDLAAGGKQLWATTLGPVRHDGAGYPGPRSTPTLDGDRLFVLGMNGDLAALDLATGRMLWKRDLVADFGGAIPNWGYSESVLIDGPLLICTPGGAKATLAALDKRTGKVVWQAAVGDGAGYASAMKATIQGVPQYVQFTAQGLLAVDAADGHLLWRYDRPANGTANCSTPIVDGNHVFAASGYGTGGGAVEIVRTEKGLEARELYFTKDMKNHHGGMVLVDGYLYGANDPGMLTCLDIKTGEVKWANRGPGKCSLVAADGMLYARSEEGRVSLVAATPSGFQMAGQFTEPQRSERPSWPHPVVADGRLYLRDQGVLACYSVRSDR